MVCLGPYTIVVYILGLIILESKVINMVIERIRVS
jgi:hypothetical protein